MPINAPANLVAFIKCINFSDPTFFKPLIIRVEDKSRLGSVAKVLVGATWLLITILVLCGLILDIASIPVVTTMSHPIIKSADPDAILVACRSSEEFATLKWLVTGPFLWANPATSNVDEPLPSKCAAVPRIAPKVITPDPPIPVIRILKGWSSSGTKGVGSFIFEWSYKLFFNALPFFFNEPPVIVIKLGQ